MGTFVTVCGLLLHIFSVEVLVGALNYIRNGELLAAMAVSAAAAFCVFIVGLALANALSRLKEKE